MRSPRSLFFWRWIPGRQNGLRFSWGETAPQAGLSWSASWDVLLQGPYGLPPIRDLVWRHRCPNMEGSIVDESSLHRWSGNIIWYRRVGVIRRGLPPRVLSILLLLWMFLRRPGHGVRWTWQSSGVCQCSCHCRKRLISKGRRDGENQQGAWYKR